MRVLPFYKGPKVTVCTRDLVHASHSGSRYWPGLSSGVAAIDGDDHGYQW
jgi:hypothetical protein